MKSEDEIMAGYLLKGGKMLSKTCPACGCPLFEYKGETCCVVCREEQAGEKGKRAAPGEKELSGISGDQPGTRGAGSSPDLAKAMDETLAVLARKAGEESDPERILVLMNAIKRGIEARNLLR